MLIGFTCPDVYKPEFIRTIEFIVKTNGVWTTGHIAPKLLNVAIHLPALALSLYVSPKVMSTSLKLWAFEYENDRKFEPFQVAGKTRHIHSLYPTSEFGNTRHFEQHTKVAIVREPVDRFLSMYRNRVLTKQQGHHLSRKAVRENGLQEAPDLELFLRNFQRYMDVSSEIAHHAAPQAVYLGNDVDFFDHVFNFRQVVELEEFLTRRVGRKQALPHEQASNRSLGIENLTSSSSIQIASMVAQIQDLCSIDYEVYGSFF